MSDLYDSVRSGETELNTAGELANIAGKFLKAEQLILAREIFTRERGAIGSPDVAPGQLPSSSSLVSQQ
jgi:hypothetical protein